jgi:hypothetical protein
MQIIDDNWQITDELYASPDDRLAIDPNELSRLAIGAPDYRTVKTQHGELLRVATLRARDPDGSGTYFIRLGYSLNTFQKAIRRTLTGTGVGARTGCSPPEVLVSRSIRHSRSRPARAGTPHHT